MDNKFCTVYMNESENFRLNKRVCGWIKDNLYAPPADADMFDKYQSKKVILMVIRKVTTFFIQKMMTDNNENEHIKEYCDCVDNVLFGLENGTVSVNGNEYKWDNGVLSGWYITIWIDSMLSFLYGGGCMRVLNLLDGVRPHEKLISQGDDLLPMITTKRRVLIWLGIMIKVLKIKFNPGKFWIENGRSEFLRKIFYGDFIDAYPIRPISKVIFKKDNEASEDTVIMEIIKKYDVLISRGCDYDKTCTMMEFEVQKFQNMAKFDRTVVESCIAYGGYGCLIENVSGTQKILAEYVNKDVKDENEKAMSRDSPAQMEIKRAVKFGVQGHVEKTLMQQLHYNKTFTKIYNTIKLVHYDLMFDMGGVETNHGIGEKFMKEAMTDHELLITEGPNIASEVAIRASKSAQIHQRIRTRAGEEVLQQISKFSRSGMTWFGGPMEVCLKKEHSYILDRVITTAIRSKTFSKSCNHREIQNVIAKSLLIMRNDIINVFKIVK